MTRNGALLRALACGVFAAIAAAALIFALIAWIMGEAAMLRLGLVTFGTAGLLAIAITRFGSLMPPEEAPGTRQKTNGLRPRAP